MLRLHLKNAGQYVHQQLKQVRLRPAILVLLLRELFRSKHEAFVGCLAAESMRLDLNSGDVSGSVHTRSVDDIERAVHAKYPWGRGTLAARCSQGIYPAANQGRY